MKNQHPLRGDAPRHVKLYLVSDNVIMTNDQYNERSEYVTRVYHRVDGTLYAYDVPYYDSQLDERHRAAAKQYAGHIHRTLGAGVYMGVSYEWDLGV